jgi:diguanylate cyclase (GGDEF)-like protein
VTERYRLEQSLLETAQTDELTQVASRRGLNRHLDAAIECARRDATPLAVALLDLDRFKDVNDRFGHARGDEVLRVVAGRLRSATYLEDCFVARLGGDEFVLMLRGDDARHNLIAVLRRLLGDLRYGIGEGEDRITVSATIGVCGLDHRHATRSTLLEAADQALYRAKRIKRGTAAIADRAEMITATDAPPPLRLATGGR